MLCLYLQAPFGVFRTFTAGSFRPTAGFIAPSAAYGLLLNICGIDMREYSNDHVMTLIRNDLPKINLSIGSLTSPTQQTMYQQLHNYPVGKSGSKFKDHTMGNKYNITPVRRSFLSNISAYICFDGNKELEEKTFDGIKGKIPRKFGLPFLGDNNFLIDKLEIVENRKPAYWYDAIGRDDEEGMRDKLTRLTITIDRQDMSKTKSALFAPIKEPSVEIPEKAWVEVKYP
jgi:CRISPR-associated protein Cas5t